METKICSKCNTEQVKENFVQKTNICKSCRKTHMKNYYLKNRDYILNIQGEYYEKNKEKQKQKYAENRELKKEKSKNYYQKNKVKANKQKRQYEKNKYDNDPLFNLAYTIRRNITHSFKNKGVKKQTKTTEILGCSFDEFKIYIESKFEPWMNWSNKGKYNGELNYGWDLDHIIPISSAKTEQEIIDLNHYTNFQPLCSKTNRNIKRGRL
jgi:hypothetical protein